MKLAVRASAESDCPPRFCPPRRRGTSTGPRSTPKASQQCPHRLVWDAENEQEIVLDGKTVARTDGVTGTVRTKVPLRLGGEIGPHFFGDEMDDITIQFTPAAPPPY